MMYAIIVVAIVVALGAVMLLLRHGRIKEPQKPANPVTLPTQAAPPDLKKPDDKNMSEHDTYGA